MAMSFVARYPDRTEIIPTLIETAIEELEHFRQVYTIMKGKGIKLRHEIDQDPYINGLLKSCRTGRDERFIDRMLIASVVECRGAERFKLVHEKLEDMELKKFYQTLWTSEAKHGNIFVELLLYYFSKDAVYKRLNQLVLEEEKVLNSLSFRPALH